eukprot:TRINITY_DN12056_c0_g1_i1.p1 TRINITY_DN12056_c0_g1~~TRINITY_DN12056_c0_g1_i1.p1  ORF type:complete len:1994 (+),score=290.44 TRINITY_DN12056_c0_g1_i1:81-6062(+)
MHGVQTLYFVLFAAFGFARNGADGQSVGITCARIDNGGNLRTSMAMLTSLGQDTASEATGVTLKGSTSAVGGTSPIWAYIDEQLRCTITNTLTSGTATYSMTQAAVSYQNLTGTSLTALTDTTPVTIIHDGVTEVPLSTTTLTQLTGSEFYLQFPCSVFGAPVRSAVEVSFSVTVTYTSGSSPVTHQEVVGPIQTHYFYGYPEDFTLACPNDADRTHAWSATLANAANAYPSFHSPVGADSNKGAMIFCYITSLDQHGAAVLPDPSFGGAITTGSYTISNTERLCTRSGAQCPKPIGKGRAALTGAEDIPFVYNIFGGTMGVVTQIAYEPFDYTQLTVTVELKSTTKTEVRIMNIAGPMTDVTVVCTPSVLDPQDTAGLSCRISPKNQETAAISSSTTAFTDDFVVSNVLGSTPSANLSNFLTVSSLVKSAVTSSFKDWNVASAPGFEFKFNVLPVAQPTSYDGSKISLWAHWNRSDVAYTRGCSGVPEDSYSLIGLNKSIDVVFAYIPKPSLGLLCSGVPCSDTVPSVLSANTTGGYSTLVVTPVVTGSGTSAVYFQAAGKTICWTSPNFTYSGSCLSSHKDFVALIDTSTGGLNLTSAAIKTPGSYHFDLMITYTYTINYTSLQDSKTANATVIINTNHIDTIGTTQIPELDVESGGGEVLVYCQDFNDTESVKAIVTVTPADQAGTPLGEEEIASVVDGFDAQTKAKAAQLAEIIFYDTSGKEDRVVPSARAVVTQVGADNPLYTGEAAYVFDNDVTTQWVDYNKKKFTITLKEPASFDHFTMVTGLDSPANDITQWVLRGSTDNVNWVSLHNQMDNYNVPMERGFQLPWFPIDRWAPIGALCTGCKVIVVPTGVVTRRHDCQWQCEKMAGCTHVNWNTTASSCDLLSCISAAPTPVPLPSTLNPPDVCLRFASLYKYIEFEPLRTREYPVPLWIFNTQEKSDEYYSVKCYLEDEFGAKAVAKNTQLLKLSPLLRPSVKSVADATVESHGTNLTAKANEGIQGVSVDEVVYYAKLVRAISVADGNVRIQFAQDVAGVLSQKVESLAALGKVSVYAHRVADAVTVLADIINVAVSNTDPTIDPVKRDIANDALVKLLRDISDPLQGLRMTREASTSVTEAASILLKGLTKDSVIPVASKRSATTLTAVEQLSSRVDSLLTTLCDVGQALLEGAPHGLCQNCTECAEVGINIHSCLDTAFNIVGTTVTPDSDTSFSLSSYAHDKDGRVNLGWPVALVGFTLPSSPRVYDPDSVLLKGRVGYVCLKHHSAVLQERTIINVTNTDIQVSVNLEPTNTASTPVGIAKRGSTSWLMDPCDVTTVTSTATATTSGMLSEKCITFAAGKPTEFAAVSTLKYGRCMAGDIVGCVHVMSTDKTFEDCACDRCTSASSPGAPAGYYVDPVAQGKYCVPYKTYTCSDSGTVTYAAALAAQCTGGSILHDGLCVCSTGLVCTTGLCEASKQCGDPGSSEQCKAAGLVHNPTLLTCECGGNTYCHTTAGDPTCVERVDCSTKRLVTNPAACTNLSRLDPANSLCVCDGTHFCNPNTHTCEVKAKCGQKPFSPSSQFCWPGAVGQPQLLAADNYVPADPSAYNTINPEDVYCQCPDNLMCNTSFWACTCPKCQVGECLYTSDPTNWQQLGHKCFCPEGFTGRNCSTLEEGHPRFIRITFSQWEYAGYEGLSNGDKTKFETAVRDVVLEQAGVGFVAGEGRPFVAENITIVYVDKGSVVVRVEVWVFTSSWERRLNHNLVQNRLAVLISRKLTGLLSEEALEAMNANTNSEATVTLDANTCGAKSTISNCKGAAAPWNNCHCNACKTNYVWRPEIERCVNDTACSNLNDCNGRGRADGLKELGCTCNCAESGFSGTKCETDDCLGSLEEWIKSTCGPVRCAERSDGASIPGTRVGECIKPEDDDYPAAVIYVTVIFSVLCCVILLIIGYYCRSLRCFWEALDDDSDTASKEDDEEGLAAVPNCGHNTPCHEPTDFSVDATECSLGD